MKMVRAIIRPEKEVPVAAALATAASRAMTKWDVLGRGKQQGVQVGDHFYDELAKCIFMVVVEDDQVTDVVDCIQAVATTASRATDGSS